MYDVESAEYRYWDSHVREMLAWVRVCCSLKRGLSRRQRECAPTEWGVFHASYEDIERALAVFDARYYQALAFRVLAARGVPAVWLIDD